MGVSVREKILNNALEMFSLRGYNSVSVREITETSNITKPTLYYYFGSKEGLFKAVLEEYYLPFIQKIETELIYEGDLPKTLEHFIGLYLEFAEKHLTFFKLLHSLETAPDQNEAYLLISPLIERQYKVIESVFIQAEKHHGNMIGRSKLYTLGLFGLMGAVIVQMIRNGNFQISPSLKIEIFRQFSYGIYT